MAMLDRPYLPGEVAEIAARGTAAMERGHVPAIVVTAAHLSAASAVLTEVDTFGQLSPEFHDAARALAAIAQLFLIVCQTGPVSAGTKQ